MTNSILNEKFNNNTFQPFIQCDNQGYSSYNQQKNKYLTQQNDTFVQQNQLEDSQNRKHKKLVITLQTIGIVASMALVGFSLNRSKLVSNKLKGAVIRLKNKFQNVQNKHFHKFFTVTTNAFDKIAKIITNSSTIKDYSLYKVMDKTSPTRKLRDFISGIFTRENKNSVRSSLKKSRESYNEFMASVESAIFQTEDNIEAKNLNILNKSCRENINDPNNPWVKLQKLVKTTRENPNEFLLSHSLEMHYNNMQKDMEYLTKEMNPKRLTSKETLQGFVAEDILEQRRYKFVKKILSEKNEISKTFDDVANYAKSRINDTNAVIYMIKDSYSQKSLIEASLDLEKSVKTYAKDAHNAKNREEIAENIRKKIDNFREKADLLPESKLKEKLIHHIDEYNDLFKDNSTGLVQKVRKLAGEVWGKDSEFDKSIKKTADRHIKDLNGSFNCLVNMFDKQRDITLGSGPGDVVGLALPILGYFAALQKDDTTDKKIGTSLELGIPIVGGTGIYFWALAKQFNGAKALLVSLGTGVILNFIGSSIFSKYKEYKGISDPKHCKNNMTIAQ